MFISNVEYQTGEVRPVEALVTRGLVCDATAALLASEGVTSYCEHPGPALELVAGSAARTLGAAGVEAADLGGVIFAQSSSRWDAVRESGLLTWLGDLGFREGPIVGLGLQGCSPFAGMLACAEGLRTRAPRPMLLVLAGACEEADQRYSPDIRTVFSDGAATALVGSETGRFRVLGRAFQHSTWLSQASLSQMARLTESVRLIRDTARRALEAAGLRASDISLLIGTNTNASALEIAADACGVSAERLWREDLHAFGHLYGCESLVGLANAPPDIDGPILVVSWSTHIVSCVVVQEGQAA